MTVSDPEPDSKAMTDRRNSDRQNTERRLAAGRKIVAEQRARIERQRALVFRLELSSDSRTLRAARELLTQMTGNLDVMLGNLYRIHAKHVALTARAGAASQQDGRQEQSYTDA